MYALTDEGRAYAEEHADELSASWDAAAGMTDDDAIELRNLIRQVMMAVMEVRRAGSAEQVAQARAVLAQAALAVPDPGRGRARRRPADHGRPPSAGTVPQDTPKAAE